MGVVAMGLVWECSQSKGNDRMVLLAIADHADDGGLYCYPGVARIAAKCLLSVRTVQRCFDRLEKMGELIVYERQGLPTKTGQTNRFQITLTRGDSFARGDNRGSQGVTDLTPRGDTAMSPKPSVEPSVKPSVSNSSLKVSAFPIPKELDFPDFVDAWERWIAYRKEIKKAVTFDAARLQMQDLKAWGKTAAIESINNSIKCRWQGLFKPKHENGAAFQPIVVEKNQGIPGPDLANLRLPPPGWKSPATLKIEAQRKFQEARKTA